MEPWYEELIRRLQEGDNWTRSEIETLLEHCRKGDVYDHEKHTLRWQRDEARELLWELVECPMDWQDRQEYMGKVNNYLDKVKAQPGEGE